MNEDENIITIEDASAGDGFGFRVKWRVTETCAQLEVYEIVGRDNDHAYFELKDSPICEHTADLDSAEKYLTGSINWDGCSHLYFQKYLHVCGAGAFKKHISLMRYLYLRASELMGRGPDGLDEPWGAKEPEIFKP